MTLDGLAIAIGLVALYTAVLGVIAGTALSVAAAVLFRTTRLGRALRVLLEEVAAREETR